MNIKTIGIVGGGKLGTALGQNFSQREEIEKILIYIRDEKLTKDINKKRRNTRYFPSIDLDKKIEATSDLSEIGKTDLIVITTPTENVEGALISLKPYYNQQPLLTTNKGLEKQGRLTHEIVNEILGKVPLFHVTGAALAEELIQGYPCCNQLASFNFSLAKDVAEQLTTKSLILKPSDDLIGAELAGSFKNLVLLLLGIAEAHYNSQNVRGALIGEGLRELNILRECVGTKTNNGLDIPLGDFYLTKSRNYQFGKDFADGRTYNGRFNPIAQFSNLLAKWRRRKYKNYIQETYEAYQEVIKFFTSGIHELVNGAEKILTGRLENKMSAAYSQNPTSETLEGYKSIIPFYLICKKLGLVQQLHIVDGLYRIFYGFQDEKDVIDQVLTNVGGSK